MRQQLEQHRKASATLKMNISALESKVAEALNKKETLKARAASAQVSSLAFTHVLVCEHAERCACHDYLNVSALLCNR